MTEAQRQAWWSDWHTGLTVTESWFLLAVVSMSTVCGGVPTNGVTWRRRSNAVHTQTTHDDVSTCLWRWWRWWWWCCVSEWLLRQYHQHITKLKWVCSTLNTRHNNSPISHLSYLPTKPRTRHLYLTLPVGTVTVEPSFSAMRHIVSVMDLCINTRTCCQSWTCVNTEVHVSVHDVM